MGLEHSSILWLATSILALFLAVAIFLLVGWWYSVHAYVCKSPYSDAPLRPWTGLSYTSMGRIYKYLASYRQYDNRMFNIRKIAFCRETGRIFPDAVTWYGKIKVDWNFLQQRYPGNWVSWGSLNEEQKRVVKESHNVIQGFQTAYSSTKPSPRAIEQEFAYIKPGPLYVDLETYILLGWKEVPGTDLEVLIVQKPIKPYRQI